MISSSGRKVALIVAAAVCAWACGNAPDAATAPDDTSVGLDTVVAELSAPDLGNVAVDVAAIEVAAKDTPAAADEGSETAVADAQSKCPGAPTCSCKENSDCDNAQCIETGNGKVCATPCIDKCEAGFKCALVNGGGGDSVTICVPKFIHLCEPCAKSKECQSLGNSDAACVKEGSLGNFCGSACLADADCDTSYGCQSVNSVEGASAKQCVKLATSPEFKFGQCSCNGLATAASAQTSCYVEHKNAKGELLGQCPGVRACGATGLSACAAPALDVEICDGKDNDCDGQTDESTCDAGGQCAIGACDGVNGCQYVKLNNVPCDADKSACTENDQCKLGICIPGSGKDCNDGNPCTSDSCDAALGCTATVLDGKNCDADGDACTTGDACVGKVCTAGKVVVCDSKSICTKSSCDLATGKCVGKAAQDDLPCDDGTVCTLTDKCKAGECTGKVISCDDKNPCTDDVCDAALGCATIILNGMACDDDNICTVGDLCKVGVCTKGAAKNCDSGAACVGGACDLATGKCAYKNKLAGSPCDDGQACSQSDECADGLCQGKSLNCDDGKPCTDDSCDNVAGCSHKSNNSPCSDGDACTLSDSCVNSGCLSGPSKVCEDNQLCTDDTCNKASGECVFAPAPMNGTPCNDNNVCTIGEICTGGACASNFTKDCNDNNVCTDDLCDKVKGCNPYFNTKACDDANACTKDDICKFGDCEGGLVKCDDGNLCTNDACDPKKGCIFTNNSIVCDDNSLCTDKDLCKSGFCVGAAVTCDDSNICSDDSCDKSIGCVNTPNVAPCPDADACTNGEVCKNFKCVVKAVVCDDANPCTTDSCDVNKGCQVKNIADNTDCGNGNKCLNGVCSLVSSSCNSLHKANAALPDGLYMIDPDGVGPLPQQQVYCDMTTSGGGWLVCYNHNINNIEEMDQSSPSHMGSQFGIPGILNEFGSDCRTLGHALQPTAIRFTNNNQNHWVQMNNPPDVAHEFFFAGNKAGGVSVDITTWNSGNTSYKRLICTHDCPSFGYNTGNINQIANGTNSGNCFEHNSKNSDSNHHWATWGKCDGSYVEGNVQGAGGPIPDQPRDGWARVMLR